MRAFSRYLLGTIAAAALTLVFGVPRVAAANTKVPILMYHNLTTDASATSSMTITQNRFQHDMEFLQQYGFTPLLSADLINIKSGAKPMPEKPVMITFDDGYESNYTLGYPILKDTGMRATISVITSHLRDENGKGYESSLTWSQVKEMYDSGIVDIGSHTNAMHNENSMGLFVERRANGIQRQVGEDYASYQLRTGNDIAASVRAIRAHLGENTKVWYFSYPFGATDSWFGQVLLDQEFYVSTTTRPRTADIAAGLYGLPRYRITMEQPVSRLLQSTVQATPTVTSAVVDGKQTRFPTYQIGGSNYVKLRDVAWMLNSTVARFSVDWNGDDISLRKGESYASAGGELVTLPLGMRTGKSMVGRVNIDGVATTLAAYNIGDNYYFKLRALGDKLGFQVAWDEINRMIILKTQ